MVITHNLSKFSHDVIFYFYCKRIISTKIVQNKILAWCGLIQASHGSDKVAAAARKAFKLNAINANEKYINTRHLMKKMSIDIVVSSSDWSIYFPSTDQCFQASQGLEDDHIKQTVEKRSSNKNFFISI